MRFGRKRPVARGPRLRLSNYLREIAMPVRPPTACDYSSPARASLTNILGNDVYGDCVIAAGYHIVGVETAGADSLYTPSLAQVLADYSKIGGYVPGKPETDQGSDPTVAINYWMQHGFSNGTKLTAALDVDPTDILELQVACYLFENLFLGFECPDAWVNPFPAGDGFLWTEAGAPIPENGHQVMATGYGPAGLTIATWGMLGTLTYAGIARYCTYGAGGDISVFLTPDQINRAIGKAPNGLSWAQLIDDFDAIGGRVPPVVVPPPAPGPTPTPPARVSLAQAKAWAIAGLEQGWPKP